MSSESTNMNSLPARISKSYEDHPAIRALAQLLPGVAAADAGLTKYFENMREKRVREFFDELAEGKHQLSSDLIENQDFLHAYFATVRAVINTRKREKIRLFAKLFKNYTSGEGAYSIDEYEEFLSILDDLGSREFQILMILDHFEKKTPRTDKENPAEWTNIFWEDFEKTVVSELGISEEELSGMLLRLVRTGLYQLYTMIASGVADKGRLTKNFSIFIDALGISDSVISENSTSI